jgi:O-glycosyl hydrolase
MPALRGPLLVLASACLAWACGGDPRSAILSSSTLDEGNGQGIESSPPVDSNSDSDSDSEFSGGMPEALPGTGPLVGSAGASGNGEGTAAPDPVNVPPTAICTPVANAGSATDGDVNIDLSLELQRIAGFGGMDGGFYPELTVSVAAAARASQLGALVMATPWSPPASMKSNGSTVAGELNVESYGAYADHLLAYRDFLQDNGVPLYAISIQNEPDIRVTYESCDWTPQQIVDWLKLEGARFEGVQLMAPESTKFDRAWSDPILQDPEASAHVDIIGGHVYGGGVADYPTARAQGKEVWMTEHYHDSANPADQWPLALGVGTDVHRSMVVNFNAYVWWAIRRAYGLLTEDGAVSKRGYVMAQYSKFVRPGFLRVSATQPSNTEVAVTAYKGGKQLVVVALNRATTAQTIRLDVFNGCATRLSRFTTSSTENLAEGEAVTLVDGGATVSLGAQSATTFVSLGLVE